MTFHQRLSVVGSRGAPFGVTASLVAAAPTTATGQGPYDTTAFAALRWREVGPYRGGRSVAVAGSVQRPMEYWMGTTGGGVFKTIDGGINWQPMTDRFFSGTIGAITVDPKNPDIVWVGGGETCIRGNTSHGDGVWMTNNAGRTWSYMGLKETEHICIRRRRSAQLERRLRLRARSRVHGERASWALQDHRRWQDLEQDSVRQRLDGCDRLPVRPIEPRRHLRRVLAGRPVTVVDVQRWHGERIVQEH